MLVLTSRVLNINTVKVHKTFSETVWLLSLMEDYIQQ